MVRYCELHGEEIEKMVPMLEAVNLEDGSEAVVPVFVCLFVDCNTKSYPLSTQEVSEWVGASRLL